MRLPNIPYASKAARYNQVRFSGIERGKQSSDGSIYDMMNISTLDFPVLKTSDLRRDSGEVYNKPWHYGVSDKEYIIAGEYVGESYALWLKGTLYNKGDIVAYGGKLYVCLKNLTTNTDGVDYPPPERGEVWEQYTETTFEYDGDWSMNSDTAMYSIWAYSGNFYRNKTGTNTDVPPAEDGVNWELYTYAKLWYDGNEVKGVELIPGRKETAYLNGYLVIIPDKIYYHPETKAFGYLSGSKSGKFSTRDYPGFFYNGKRFDYPLEAYLTHGENLTGEAGDGIYNAIVLLWSTRNLGMRNDAKYGVYDLTKIFQVGDVIGVDQNTAEMTYVASITDGEYTVNKIGIDYIIFPTGLFSGDAINFDEESHYVSGGKDYWYLGSVKFTKGIPDMEHICTAGNRMWGCKGDEVFGSANGDCKTWKNYASGDGGSVALLAGDIGDFTACCEYGGNPMFFKENEMWRVSGYGASTYALSKVADYGIRKDSPLSACVVDSILFFASPVGICAYSGGVPAVISSELKKQFSEAICATDGKRYYVSVNEQDGRRIYVYDIAVRGWSSEYAPDAVSGMVGNNHSVWCLTENGNKISVYGGYGDTIPPETKAYIEFNDWYDGSMARKSVGRVIIRAEVNPEYAPLIIYIQYDSDGEWHKIGELYRQNEKKGVSEFGFCPRRCSHYRIRLECKGEFALYAMERQIID